MKSIWAPEPQGLTIGVNHGVLSEHMNPFRTLDSLSAPNLATKTGVLID
jgi:hypothetical protein